MFRRQNVRRWLRVKILKFRVQCLRSKTLGVYLYISVIYMMIVDRVCFVLTTCFKHFVLNYLTCMNCKKSHQFLSLCCSWFAFISAWYPTRLRIFIKNTRTRICGRIEVCQEKQKYGKKEKIWKKKKAVVMCGEHQIISRSRRKGKMTDLLVSTCEGFA